MNIDNAPMDVGSSNADVSAWKATRLLVTSRSCTPGTAASPAGGVTSSATIDVLVKCRSSASEPDSAVWPWRMIVTRSHSASTSLRM